MNNKSMQDIKHKREREKDEQSQTWENYFEHTSSTSPLSTLRRISNIIDLARSLGAATSTTSSLKNS